MGWGTNLAILSNWFPKKGRGILVGIWASNANIGDIIGTQLYKLIAGNSKVIWGTPLIVIGCGTIGLGFLNLLFMYEFPLQKGYKLDEDASIIAACCGKKKRSSGDGDNSHSASDSSEVQIESDASNIGEPIGIMRAIAIPGVLQFSLAFTFLKFSTYGFFLWLPKYLEDYVKLTADQASDFVTVFDIGSVVGNLLLGLTSDFFPVRSPFFLLAIILGTGSCLGITFVTPSTPHALILFWLFTSGGLITGASIIIAAIECDIGKR